MNKSIYFASDLHLGAPNYEKSRAREARFVKWLEHIRPTADTLYLVGDIFDFWFEYRKAVPKGYVRLLGKLAQLSDEGVKIHLFTGNHDLWYGDYFPQELNIQIHTQPYEVTHHNKQFYIAHGDGLGPGDKGYKFLKRIFTFPLNQWLFERLHPNFGISFAEFCSKLSENYNTKEQESLFYGEQESLLLHSRQMLKENNTIDYFVYGHRHLLKTLPLTETTTCFYLGDWILFDSYLEWDGVDILLKKYETI